MKYAFDLDDTLSDTATVINEYAVKFDKEFLNGDGKMKEIDNSVDYYYFAEALNWNKDNIRDFFKQYYIEIIKKVKIKPLVAETIDKLKKGNNKIYIITARRKREENEIENITKKWLDKNKIYYDELYINAKEKFSLVNELSIDYFIYDSYKNCKEVLEKTKAQVFMIETKFNKQIKDNKIKIIKNINQILKEI